MEESPRIQTFEQLPSPSEFSSQIQSRNVPSVFVGCVKEWKAFSRWNPSHGGLDYLQVPIMSVENGERVQLENLRENIKMPLFLETKSLTSINMWMNNAQARSSTHYDMHHNILCIISGYKCPVAPFWKPLVIPNAIYGEASNHRYPKAEGSVDYTRKVILHAGDAPFIPEGWDACILLCHVT